MNDYTIRKRTENVIKFSHNYPKLPKEDTATLVYIGDLRVENQTKAFIDYDTTYLDNYDEVNKVWCGSGKYELKKVDYLLLLFKTPKGAYFTTIRSKIGMFGKDKKEYYFSRMFQEFKIKIEGGKI